MSVSTYFLESGRAKLTNQGEYEKFFDLRVAIVIQKGIRIEPVYRLHEITRRIF